MPKHKRQPTPGPKAVLNTEALDEAAVKAGDVTRKAIAMRAGLEPSTLCRLYDKDRPVEPKVLTLLALRRAYGFTHIEELLTEVPTEAEVAA